MTFWDVTFAEQAEATAAAHDASVARRPITADTIHDNYDDEGKSCQFCEGSGVCCDCDGTGEDHDDDEEECDTCDGTGQCHHCGGSGEA